ncbi:TPA: restriction endonuclease subunit S [Campylobacter lari]|nr:restriction endonuclease subunit S [Campylobacter lari]
MKEGFFYISDFFDIQLARGDLKEDDCEAGEYPLVTSGVDNFGIASFTNGKSLSQDQNDSELFEGNCITLDMFCNAFYRDKPFFAVSHGRVNILIPKLNLNKYHLLYICTLLNYEKFRFSYGRAVYKEVAKKIQIKLPVCNENNSIPDWQFIEDYIKSLPYGDCL